MTRSGVLNEEHDLNFPHEPPKTDMQGTISRWVDSILESRRYRDAEGRGPDPDSQPVTADDLERLVQRIAREQQSGFNMGNYNEGGGGKWDRWAMPGLVTLAVTGIIGNVVQAMQVAALRQEVTDLQTEMTKIEKLVEPRYRGG